MSEKLSSQSTEGLPEMSRREFLERAVKAGAVAFIAKDLMTSPSEFLFGPETEINRKEKWRPTDQPIQWRYLAGRITRENEDFGFVVSLAENKVPGFESQELLVQRQNFTEEENFVGTTYKGQLTYDENTATYTFVNEQGQELARWQWQENTQTYQIQVQTEELALFSLELQPQGSLIPEGGDGEICVGHLGTEKVLSTYHADWTEIKTNGATVGVARLDMQDLRLASGVENVGDWVKKWSRRKLQGDESVPVAEAGPKPDYDHHWFSLAVTLKTGAKVYLSCWRIEDEVTGSPFWDVTIATKQDEQWLVHSWTEENIVSNPLEITTTFWQPVPDSESKESTGCGWHLKAGESEVGDLIDLEVDIPEGQFIQGEISPRGLQSWMEEGIGTDAKGTILGIEIESVQVVAAESTAEYYLQHLPVIQKNS